MLAVIEHVRWSFCNEGSRNWFTKDCSLIYPKPLFTHCYAYSINVVLQQSLAIIKGCRVVLSRIKGFINIFFLNVPKELIH
jgi:hypothetical protein